MTGLPPCDRWTPTGRKLPIAPMHRRFFKRRLANPHRESTIGCLLAPPRPVARAEVEAVLASLVHAHDALRMCFPELGADGHAQLCEPGPLPFARLTPDQHRAQLESLMHRLAANIDLRRAPLWALAMLLDEQGLVEGILFVFHHLISDGLSIHTLGNSLNRSHAPLRPSSFAGWLVEEHERVRSDAHAGEYDYWFAPERLATAQPCQLDHGSELRRDQQCLTHPLWRSDRDASLPPNELIEQLTLLATAQALTRWCPADLVKIDVSHHGRQDIRAGARDRFFGNFGFYVTQFPLVFPRHRIEAPSEAIAYATAASARVPGQGQGYARLQYGSEQPACPAYQLPCCDFAYHSDIYARGNLKRGNNWSGSFIGSSSDPRNRRLYPFFVSINRGPAALVANWVWSSSAASRSTVAELAHAQQQAFTALTDSL